MKKRAFSALVLALILLGSLLCGLALATEPDSVPAATHVQDMAGLLTDAEVSKLDSKIAQLVEKYNFDLAIVTVNAFSGSSIIDWADSVYAESGYGRGEEKDGLMLSISMAERDWAITEYGYGAYAFNAYGREVIADKIVPHLSDGDYYKAFARFLDLADEFLQEAGQGQPYSESHRYRRANVALTIGISLAVSLIGAFCLVYSWLRSMNTRRQNSHASSYVVADSFQLHDSRDIFLYHTVTRVRRPKPSNSGGGGGKISVGRGGHGSSGKF